MRRLLVLLFLVGIMGACANSRPTGIDDRPPAFRARGIAISWTTDEPAPTADWIDETRLEFRLPILLVPTPPAEGEAARFFFRADIADFDRSMGVSVNFDDNRWLRVTASTLVDEVACGPSGEQLDIRGSEGCFTLENPGQLMLSWEEKWVFEARWTQSVDDPPDQYREFFVGWLDEWKAYPD